jgi:hypothetical protein
VSTGESKKEAGQNRPGTVAFLPQGLRSGASPKNAHTTKPSSPVVTRPANGGFCAADSSEPAPSHRPWVLAPSATSGGIAPH